MLWAPKDYVAGDPTVIRVDDEFHFFTEATPKKSLSNLGTRVIYHAKSKDGLKWEELPPAIKVGEPGTFDGFTLYHFDVYVHDGTWYMYYTGLDKPGAGQKQATGLATSKDGIHWEKHPNNPVDFADPAFYEQAIPREATYQKKDFGRLWYRDPTVFQDKKSGQFGIVTNARDKTKPLDTRGCIAWSTSTDLIHWKRHPPIYSPNRFHTVEVPAMVEHAGRHYLLFMAHWNWGTPYITTDPYQVAGCIFAISDTGWLGPYHAPKDEILMGSAGQIRLGTQRFVDDGDGNKLWYGELFARPSLDDVEARLSDPILLPTLKPVIFQPDGAIHVMYPAKIYSIARPTEINPAWKPVLSSKTPGWQWADGKVSCKNFPGASRIAFGPKIENFIFSSKISFITGERAGFLARSNADATEGWQIVVDRRARRVEYKTLQPLPKQEVPQSNDIPDGEANDFAGASGGSVPASLGDFIDARAWQGKDEVELKIVADSISLEVYVDNRLMLHQVRHREVTGQVGFVVERGQAQFSDYRLLKL